jgi:dihydroorotase
MEGSLLLKNGRLLDPESGRDGVFDILVADGRVVRVAPEINPPADRVEDLSGLWVMPGAIDLHVHLREPGFEYKETILSGAEAAAAGGFTAIACMANTRPVNDNAAVTRMILEEAARAPVRVLPIAAISRGMRGETLVEMGDLVAAGAVAFSEDGRTVANTKLLRHAMEYASLFDKRLFCHCQDDALFADGVVHEGMIAAAHGFHGIPALAEEIDIARTIMLAEYLKLPVHICHLSTRGGVELVRAAKERGVMVTAEVTPHHLFLDARAVAALNYHGELAADCRPAPLSFNTNTKMSPPLRSAEDVEAVREALAAGVIDAVATDHAPHEATEKAVEYALAPFGVVGLETALGLLLRLVAEGRLTPLKMAEVVSRNPARILGFADSGRVSEGAAADLTVIDPEAEWLVEPEKFRSKARNTPFAGWKLPGRVVKTLVAGRVVFELQSKT